MKFNMQTSTNIDTVNLFRKPWQRFRGWQLTGRQEPEDWGGLLRNCCLMSCLRFQVMMMLTNDCWYIYMLWDAHAWWHPYNEDWSTIDQAYNKYCVGSNVESVEVTEEAVKGMSAPTFYYAEVGWNLSLWWITPKSCFFFRSKVKKAQRVRRI